MTSTPQDSTSPPSDSRWNIKRLWQVSLAVLAIVFLLDLPKLFQDAEHSHAHYGVDGWFGFYSIYGFVTCVIMVVFSKALGFILKRKDDYYDE